MKKMTTIATMALTSCSALAVTNITQPISQTQTSASTITAPKSNTTSKTAAKTAETTTVTSASFCPQINQIVKNPQKDDWTAQTTEGSWKSYGVSFATVLTKFTGAQWTGAKVGQVTCVYDSQQVFTVQGQQVVQPTLPVLLVLNSLVFQPTEGKWKHANKREVYNCYSVDHADCPFKINTPKPTGNIFKQAEQFKNMPPATPQPTTH